MKSKKIISFIPVFVWLIIILVLSGYSGNQLPKVAIWQVDKFAHIIMYGILSLLLFLPFSEQFLKREMC